MIRVVSEPTTDCTAFLGMDAIIVSEPMRELMELVQRIARAHASVLITGESGVGKELVARAIHHYSMRSHRPWVDLSCAALPEHLIESELFGYERGAFSGADSGKPGLFELAHTGTIFLDEIGELDPKVQVKLLRVLDGVPYYRLGGTKKVSVDVRIVAATNRDLRAAVANGMFRNDLYHRLAQFTLEVPPLRERTDDIAPLARHFLTQQDPEMRFSESALTVFKEHSWPGNIRELRNAVTKAAVMARDQEILAADLELGDSSSGNSIRNEVHNLEGMEKRAIMDALAAVEGHQSKAAERLGISRRTLSRKLKLYAKEGEALSA